MENSALLFPTSQLLATNDLILASLNPLAHSLDNSLSQKRFNPFSTISEDLEPVKKHLKNDFTVNSQKSTKEQPILIDDAEPMAMGSMDLLQNSNVQNLLQLSLFSAYLEQVQQAREVERRYSELFAKFSQSLFNQNNRETDTSTNVSEIDSISNIISNQASPNENKCRRMSMIIDLESDNEEEVLFIDIPLVNANIVENKKPNDQINISADLLADLPNLYRKGQDKNARSRNLKLVWTPEEQKTKDLEKITKELEEGLSIKISNQERVCKLYSEHGFSVKETVKNVVSQRSKYRFILKDKRAVVSMKNKSVKL